MRVTTKRKIRNAAAHALEAVLGISIGAAGGWALCALLGLA